MRYYTFGESCAMLDVLRACDHIALQNRRGFGVWYPANMPTIHKSVNRFIDELLFGQSWRKAQIAVYGKLPSQRELD